MKKYCNSCGNIVPNRARKCRNCGFKLVESDQPSAKYLENYAETSEKSSLKYKLYEKMLNQGIPMKKNLFMIFPFFLIPGIGLMYAGNIKRGIKFLIAFLVVVFIDVFTKVVFQIYFLIYLVGPLYTILIIWGIVASIKEIKNYNTNIDSIMRKKHSKSSFTY